MEIDDRRPVSPHAKIETVNDLISLLRQAGYWVVPSELVVHCSASVVSTAPQRSAVVDMDKLLERQLRFCIGKEIAEMDHAARLNQVEGANGDKTMECTVTVVLSSTPNKPGGFAS